jgi:hypothetical protein
MILHLCTDPVEAHTCRLGYGRTGLHLCLLGLADDELVELLLVFGAEVLETLLDFGGDLELVHCDRFVGMTVFVVLATTMVRYSDDGSSLLRGEVK